MEYQRQHLKRQMIATRAERTSEATAFCKRLIMTKIPESRLAWWDRDREHVIFPGNQRSDLPRSSLRSHRAHT